jgi:hypothetical protein
MDHLSTQNPGKVKEDKTHFVYNRWPLLFILMGLVIFLSHCPAPMTQKQTMAPNRPEKKVFNMKPEVVKEAVQRALEKKKFILAAKQSNELHLETEWLEDQGYRSKVEVDLEPLSRSKTQLTLTMYLEKKLLFQDKWEPMDEIGEDTYKILLGEIEMECYRVLYDRS